jgi:hypothetical protein
VTQVDPRLKVLLFDATGMPWGTRYLWESATALEATLPAFRDPDAALWKP